MNQKQLLKKKFLENIRENSGDFARSMLGFRATFAATSWSPCCDFAWPDSSFVVTSGDPYATLATQTSGGVKEIWPGKLQFRESIWLMP